MNTRECVNVLCPNKSRMIKLKILKRLPILLLVWQISGNKLAIVDRTIVVIEVNKSV